MKKPAILTLTNNAIKLLKKLIETPSLSGEESETAALIEKFLNSQGVESERKLNNV